jgi:DNA-binding LacI/PurR family transcriptional regulator
VAGVAQSTVSYVLTGRRPVSAATRQRVFAAMAQLDYHPNAGARALASQRTQVIALVVPYRGRTDRVGLLPFIETMAVCAREHDHDVLLVIGDEGGAGLARISGRSLCDAIVLMDIERHDRRIPVAAGLPVPVILIGVPEDRAGLPCVDLDFEQAARLAIDHLADTGHDRVVELGYAPQLIARELKLRAPVHDRVRRGRGRAPAASRGRPAGARRR